MKKILIALTMIAALVMPAESYAQKNNQRANVKITASTGQDSVSIDAYSDTTGVDTTDEEADSVAQMAYNTVHKIMTSDDSDFDDSFGFAITVLLILFIFSPAIIIGLICYFIYRYRKQKLQLAEMAMKNGQPIPQNVKTMTPETPDDYWKAGIKKIAIGLGIAVLAVIGFSSWSLAGIGLFVAIYGAGQIVIAKTTAAKQANEDTKSDDTELTDGDF